MADAFDSQAESRESGGLSGGSGDAAIPNSRCVLWLHPQDVVPKPLLKSLSRRIEKTVFTTDSYQALAEVCAASAESKREGRPCPVVLLLIKPARLAEAGDVLHHVDMYAPRTRRWRFDPSANPIFAPMSEQDIARIMRESGPARHAAAGSNSDPGDSQAPDVVVRKGAGASVAATLSGRSGAPIFPVLSSTPRPRPRPRLRLVESDPSAETLVGGPGATNFSQLTPEELQMLLNDPPTGDSGGDLPGKSSSVKPPRSR